MNKDKIIKTLRDYSLNEKEILVLSGASMVINGIKEKTNDIDIAVSKKYEKELLDTYDCIIKEVSNGNNVYSIDGKIEFSVNYYVLLMI